MPNYKTHDKITTIASITALPVATLAGQSVGLFFVQIIPLAIILASTIALSGYLFSPDVDCAGYLRHRWGILRGIWLPYYWLAHQGGHFSTNGHKTHRSYLSHSPVVGSLSKVAYLSLWLLPMPMAKFGYVALWLWVHTHLPVLMAVLLGMEVGSMVHYCADWVKSELS